MAESPVVAAVAMAQQGDARAFDSLVRRFQDSAVACARAYLRDRAAAEDAAQEAFVQAWLDLPTLANPAAFGAWLRRIVFKHCDRTRRSARPALPLPESEPGRCEHEPLPALERAERAARVHEALWSLPDLLREATLLYYLAGYDVKEIAAVLEVPPSTVKNRLHAARKRLRKELWEMADDTLGKEKPSRNEAFAAGVLARVLREFEEQEATDPHTADRSLLDQGRKALFEVAGSSGALDDDAVRAGFTVLWRKQDWPALSALLMRYLGQPLSDSQTTWAYVHLALGIANTGSAAGAVLAHESFERWMPGKSPCLSAHWPYYPASEGASGGVIAGDDVRLLFLGQNAEFTTAYLGCWRNDDYLAKVDAALTEIPPTARNRPFRFYMLRMACNACQTAGNLDRAGAYIRRMVDLSEEGDDSALKAEYRLKALGHTVDLARARSDEAAVTARLQDAMALMADLDRAGLGSAPWARGERHNLACELVRAGKHDMALPLWEANLASGGHIGGWGWLSHAATLWKVAGDRERTLMLLREARAHDDRDMAALFAERPEFADVREDPDFLAAVSRSG